MRTFLKNHSAEFERDILGIICEYASSIIKNPWNQEWVCNAKLLIGVTNRRHIGRIRVQFTSGDTFWLKTGMWNPIINYRLRMCSEELIRLCFLLAEEGLSSAPLVSTVHKLERYIVKNYSLVNKCCTS